jgi:folate-binding protein YgfZ
MMQPMPGVRIALLADRGVVRVAGEDAAKLLQGLITSDMELLTQQPALHAALLSPQGKILFDFFVAKIADGFLLETARAQAAGLAKRLAMYKLRAKVDIRDASDDFRVLAVWGEGPVSASETAGLLSFPDPRLAALGLRVLAAATGGTDATSEAYHAHRIGLGVPEGGRDYTFGDAFPHEADLDQLGGVSFTKGCFIGQEVVSRMQNRATVRKRVVPVTGEASLTMGADITAGTDTIGSIGSVSGLQALALLRLDRAAEAEAKGEPLRAGGVTIALRKPSWAEFELPPAVTASAP